MSIAAGLSAAKAGFDLIKSLREALGRPNVNPGDVQARLVELNELLLETQGALSEAKEERQQLLASLEKARIVLATDEDMEFLVDGGFYVRKTENGQIPYCPVCWKADSKTIPLLGSSTEGMYDCPFRHGRFMTNKTRRMMTGVA